MPEVVLEHHFRSDLAQLKVPTPSIPGNEDKTVPIDASSEAAAKGIKHSKLVEYDGAQHGVFATISAGSPRTCSIFSGAELSFSVVNGGHQVRGSNAD